MELYIRMGTFPLMYDLQSMEEV
ncbi:uncharacterized protein METZ01_LOCUS192438 [marine metagenome]|uniref:Uncharacterized protein n=1 Tax=marine metagenome TaxID=408172 RepID=A0A382DNM1_9ZZZZ